MNGDKAVESEERWFIYFFADTHTYCWCEMHDEEKLHRYNKRLNKGGCVFTHAGYCTMASSAAFMQWGQRESPLDFSKINIIMEEENPMKVTIQEAKEEGLLSFRLAFELELLEKRCAVFAQFLDKLSDKIEDMFTGETMVFLYTSDRETAARIQAFIEKGSIDNFLEDARWVSIDEKYWLALTFIKEDK